MVQTLIKVSVSQTVSGFPLMTWWSIDVDVEMSAADISLDDTTLSVKLAAIEIISSTVGLSLLVSMEISYK